MEENTWLTKIVYEFTQDGNTDGTTKSEEILNIEVQCGTDSIEKEGGYLVLRTPTGWSINDSKEINELLKLVENGISLKK